jgi:hypothetical protein
LCIAYPESEEEIVQCVKHAVKNGVKITVRGGGHSARSMETGVMVIDTSKMKSIEVDEEKKTVVAGPGFKLGEIQEKLAEHGLAIASGVNATVGLVGQLLVGGQGYLTRKYGLLIDNVISLRLVTCKGDAINVNENENSDLFWALRGGAGHFGIVSQVTLKAHIQPPVYAGALIFSAEGDAYKPAIQTWLKIRTKAEEEDNRDLCMAPVCAKVPTPDGGMVALLFIFVLYDGAEEKGAEILKPLVDLEHQGSMKMMKFCEALQMQVPAAPAGQRYNHAGRNNAKIDLDYFDICIKEAVQKNNLAFSFEDYQGGKQNEVATGATAFGHRVSPKFGATLWFAMPQDENGDSAAAETMNAMFERLKEYVTEEAYAAYFDGQINRAIAYDSTIRVKLEEMIPQHDPEKLLFWNST